MTQGRKICNALKDIRKRIADANGISYSPDECTHEGDCAGTCPRCDQELSALTAEIHRRRRLGLAVSVAGLAMGISSLSSCHIIRPPQVVGKMIDGNMTYESETYDSTKTQSDDCVNVMKLEDAGKTENKQ